VGVSSEERCGWRREIVVASGNFHDRTTTIASLSVVVCCARKLTLRPASPLVIARSDLDVGLNAIIDVLTH
jgi:hypothetical protein